LPELGRYFLAFIRPDLAGMGALLGSPGGTTRVYCYFLASDFFIGRWCYRDSRQRGVSPWAMAPILFMTLILGPFGWIFYVLFFARKASGAGEPPGAP
jgi:hypothetical protein